MRKQAVTQRSFILGEVREGFLEADDLEIRQMSCRRVENMVVTATRTLRGRPGSTWVSNADWGTDLIELRPESGVIFGIMLRDDRWQIIDKFGAVKFTSPSVPWALASDAYVVPFREKTIIGGPLGVFELLYDAGSWTYQPLTFVSAPGGEMAQPYWSYEDKIRIRPSARTGSVTVTSSLPLFSAAYVGQRIRYSKREILITSYVNPTNVVGTVVTQLPPAFQLKLTSVNGLRIGDALISETTNFSGIVEGISGLFVNVTTVDFFDGPDINEKIAGPATNAKVDAKVEIPPVETHLWDEPLISPARGYPRSASSAASRLVFVDFPILPDLICMSSVRNIQDFKSGLEDDDAIIRTCGDDAPRFMHVINAGDLLLFSDRGLYYINIRDNNNPLTPASFRAIPFDKRACSPVKPISVDDGVVFVEASGQAIAACLLDGNIYLKWTVRTISNYHDHLIKSPVKLCGPSLFAETTEKYMFVVNADGSMAAVSWFTDFAADSVGFIPWTTEGEFQSISPIFGGYYGLIDRVVNGTPQRFLEQFSNDMVMDCCVEIIAESFLTANGVSLTANGVEITVNTPANTPLIGEEVSLWGGGWYGGRRTVGLDGVVPDIEDMPEGSFVGYPFTTIMQPWPVEVINSPRAGLLKARVIRGSVSVLNTNEFSVRANKNTRSIGGYAFGDDLTAPPALRTKVCKFSVVGMRDHPEIEVLKPIPGKIEILAVTQEVQY